MGKHIRTLTEDGIMEYEDHEVWVGNDYHHGDEVSFIRLNEGKCYAQAGFFKATLRIPKPERKVEITERGLENAFNKVVEEWKIQFPNIKENRALIGNLKKEIFEEK